MRWINSDLHSTGSRGPTKLTRRSVEHFGERVLCAELLLAGFADNHVRVTPEEELHTPLSRQREIAPLTPAHTRSRPDEPHALFDTDVCYDSYGRRSEMSKAVAQRLPWNRTRKRARGNS